MYLFLPWHVVVFMQENLICVLSLVKNTTVAMAARNVPLRIYGFKHTV